MQEPGEKVDRETRLELTLGGARWRSREQPGLMPMVESREGRGMVEKALTTPCGRALEMEPLEVETQVEQSRWRARLTPEVQRANAELTAHASEAETRNPEDCGRAGATEDNGGAGGKKPDGARGMEG